MRMVNDCLPCIARGGLDVAKLATGVGDPYGQIKKKVLDTIHESLTMDISGSVKLFKDACKKAKCPVVANHAGCKLNDIVIKHLKN